MCPGRRGTYTSYHPSYEIHAIVWTCGQSIEAKRETTPHIAVLCQDTSLFKLTVAVQKPSPPKASAGTGDQDLFYAVTPKKLRLIDLAWYTLSYA